MREFLIASIVVGLCLTTTLAQPLKTEPVPVAVTMAERIAKDLNDRLLTTRSTGERYECLRRLQDLHPDVAARALPGVVEALANKDDDVVKSACNVVIHIGEPAGKLALPALLEVLETKYEPPGTGNTISTAYVHERAYWAIAICCKTDPEKSLPAMITCLKDSIVRERRRAGAYGIRLLGQKAATEDVKKLALERVSDKHEDPWVCFNLGVYFWETHKDKRGVGTICLSLLKGGGVAPANDVEYAALKYLKEHKLAETMDYLPLLKQALFHRHHNSSGRCAAIAELLASYGEKAADAVPDLAEAVSGQYPSELRFQAAVALGNMGVKAQQTVPVLKKALKDRDSGVDLAASYTLTRLEPSAPEHPMRLLDAITDPSTAKWARSTALGLLGRLGKDGITPEFREKALAELTAATDKASRPADKLALLNCRWQLARDKAYLEYLGLCLRAMPEGPDTEAIAGVVALGPDAKPLLPELRRVRQQVWAISTYRQVIELIEALESGK